MAVYRDILPVMAFLTLGVETRENRMLPEDIQAVAISDGDGDEEAE
jgi:hypothetical protein